MSTVQATLPQRVSERSKNPSSTISLVLRIETMSPGMGNRHLMRRFEPQEVLQCSIDEAKTAKNIGKLESCLEVLQSYAQSSRTARTSPRPMLPP
jgi:hypothetical protein